MLGNFAYFFCCLLIIFEVSADDRLSPSDECLDPDRPKSNVQPDLGPAVCKGDTSRSSR